MHPNGNTAGGGHTAYGTGRLADTERFGWLSASFCCVLAAPPGAPFVIQNILSSGRDVGVYAVRLFISGRWITIVVDDYFPCEQLDDGSDQWTPLFAAPREVNTGGLCVKELWPCILEKAWAKYNGSYEAALSMITRTEDAAAVLTGGIAKTFAVGPQPDAARGFPSQLRTLRLPSWESFSDLLHQGGHVCCCENTNRPHHSLISKDVSDVYRLNFQAVCGESESRPRWQIHRACCRCRCSC